MQSLLLPAELDRKSIALNFDFITPVGWQRLFDKEKANGLFALRVTGADYDRAYYSTMGIIQWLIRNGRYSLSEIRDQFYDLPPVAAHVKVHRIAG